MNNDILSGLNPVDFCVHSIFEKQVAATPEAIALVTATQSLSYQELNSRANQLARFLLTKGIKPDQLIGIYCERSLEMVVALLAVIKAGAAYLPLSSESPVKRLQGMCEDANIDIVLGNISATGVPTSISHYIDLNNIEEVMAFSASNLSKQEVGVNARNLAYAIFTSGTSGYPKASLLEHRGLTNLAFEQIKAFEVSKESRVLQFASFSFDAATSEWAMALCSGASLYLLTEEQLHSPDLLEDYIQAQNITHATLPPALLPTLNVARWHSLTHLVVAGEACDLHLANIWARNRKFYNAYGPSEATVCTTIARYIENQPQMVLGEPIGNTIFYVWDDNFQPTAVEETGELFIGGIGLSREYFNRPELNKEKFIANPDVNSPWQKLYRSGDIVKLKADGAIVFVCRKDDQIKLHGKRIELQEIKALLLASKGVEQAVVQVREDPIGNKRIHAWVTSRDEEIGKLHQEQLHTQESPQVSKSEVFHNLPLVKLTKLAFEAELRESLSLLLPDFMCPASITVIDKFPLTVNKKIDLHALNVPLLDRSSMPWVAPKNEIEQTLCRIWQIELNIKNIGIEDNFFWMGGDSLAAIRIVNRVKDTMSLSAINYSQLVNAQTIKRMAEVIHFFKQDNSGASARENLPTVKRQNSKIDLPVSSTQRVTLFMQEAARDVSYCNTPAAWTLQGDLQADALEFAIQKQFNSQEALRTTYYQKGEFWLQKIAPHIAFSLNTHDFNNEQISNKSEKIQAIFDEQKNYEFNLECDPPLHIVLIKLNKKEHILSLVFHQVAFDGQSAMLFLQDIGKFYYQKIDETSNIDVSKQMKFTYIDYINWINELRTSEMYEKSLDWWKTYLKSAPALHSLYLNYKRPGLQEFKGEIFEFSLPSTQKNIIEEFSRKQHVSLFVLLQTVFTLLLSKYSGKEEVVTGTVVANRMASEFSEIVGNFANTLALRQRIDATQTFLELLQSIHKNIEQVKKHQYVLFDDLVEHIAKRRSPSHSPIVQILFVLQDEKQNELTLHNLQVKNTFQDPGIAKFDLTLHVYPENSGLTLHWEYNTALFNNATIEKLNSYFNNLLTICLQEPRKAVSQLEFINAEDSLRKLPIPKKQNFIQPKTSYVLFREQVARQANKTAIVDGVREISYQQLAEKVEAIAAAIQCKIDIKNRQAIVAVYLDKSIDLIASMLAIHKLEAIYLPMDPHHPKERVRYTLSDAGADVIVSNSHYVNKLSKEIAASRVNLDVELTHKKLSCAGVPNYDIEKTAYIIYTSGSTGKPKGVLISQENLFYSLLSNKKALNFTEHDIIPALGSQAFGVSILEFFLPLTCGATIRLVSREVIQDTEQLVQEIQDSTILHAVPSLLNNWLQFAKQKPEYCKHLKLIFTGGEAVPIELIKNITQWNKKISVLATYGMTEATVICSAYSWNEQDTGAYYLGKPYETSYFRILDAYGKLTAQGVPGELHVGGLCIGQGYLNLTEMTNNKFFQDPYISNQRLFKTGDRVRLNASGNIEFLGRIDNQINLRGMRIEYGEIESVLMTHPKINRVIVSVKNINNNEDTLVAYIKSETKVPRNNLMAHAAKFLPDYMCPQVFVQLDEFPLNANGKIDRNTLPLPNLELLNDETVFQKAITENEKMLSVIWKSLLGLEKVSVESNFFELGGNSLMLSKVINRIRAEQQVKISMASIFKLPTIRALAIEIDSLISKQVIYEMANATKQSKETEIII